MTLSDVFAAVTVTPGQGITVLNSLAEANADKDPELAAAINAAIVTLSSQETAADQTSTKSR